MPRRQRKRPSLLERIIVFAAAFIAVLFFMFAFRGWRDDFVGYYFRTDKWLELFFVILVSLALSQILVLLLRWEFRKEFFPKK